MKLVRARPKRVEDLPEWAKCCDESISRDQSVGETRINLDDTWVTPALRCRLCGLILPQSKDVKIMDGVAGGQYFPIECLDIDEGPMESISTA